MGDLAGSLRVSLWAAGMQADVSQHLSAGEPTVTVDGRTGRLVATWHR